MKAIPVKAPAGWVVTANFVGAPGLRTNDTVETLDSGLEDAVSV